MKWSWEPAQLLPQALADGAFQQSPAYQAAVRACGGRIERAVLRDGGDTLAQVQVMRRAGLAVALRGPVWVGEATEATQARGLRRLARLASPLIALPETAVQGFGLIPLMTPRHVALWDLRPEPEALRRQMQGKWRNALVAAERRGVRASLAPVKALAGLIAAEAAQRQVRRYRALPAAFTAGLPVDALRLWRWQDHAAMCFVRHGSWATYHLGHADAAARVAGAHRVLLWQAACALRAEGVRVLDLGDINTEDAPGLARFKLGTGAVPHALGATCLVLPG